MTRILGWSLLALLTTTGLAHARLNGPNARYTGAPGDNPAACAQDSTAVQLPCLICSDASQVASCASTVGRWSGAVIWRASRRVD